MDSVETRWVLEDEGGGHCCRHHLLPLSFAARPPDLRRRQLLSASTSASIPWSACPSPLASSSSAPPTSSSRAPISLQRCRRPAAADPTDLWILEPPRSLLLLLLRRCSLLPLLRKAPDLPCLLPIRLRCNDPCCIKSSTPSPWLDKMPPDFSEFVNS